MEELKKAAALAAVKFVKADSILGVGTGSTVNYFIEALATVKNKIEGAIASSIGTAQRLKTVGIPVLELNSVDNLALYIDGADAVNKHLQLIKGGGGALTREKIIASAARQFICIADERKACPIFDNQTAIPLEVIPMARSFVARELVKLGGSPVYRQGFTTDNGNCILDVFNLALEDSLKLEKILNNIAGVVCNGIFAQRPANLLLLATATHGVVEQQAV